MVGGERCRWLEQLEWSEAIDEEQANAGPRWPCHIFCRVTSTCVGAVGELVDAGRELEENWPESKRHLIQGQFNRLSCWPCTSDHI